MKKLEGTTIVVPSSFFMTMFLLLFKLLKRWMTVAKTNAVAYIFRELHHLQAPLETTDYLHYITSVQRGKDAITLATEWDIISPHILAHPDQFIPALNDMIASLIKKTSRRPEINVPGIRIH